MINKFNDLKLHGEEDLKRQKYPTTQQPKMSQGLMSPWRRGNRQEGVEPKKF